MKGEKDFIPIENLLLEDTIDVKNMKTLRGKEFDYAHVLGGLEIAIACHYLENPDIKDKDIEKKVKVFMENFSGGPLDEATLEGKMKMAASLGLQEKPLTRHEFLLCFQYVLDAIDNRSWIPDERAYLNWVANFFNMLPNEEKKKMELSYDILSKAVGVDRNLLLRGSNVKGKLSLKKFDRNLFGFHYPTSWDGISTMVYDAMEMMDSESKKDRQEGAAILKDTVEMSDGHPLALSEYGAFLIDNGKKEEALKLIEKVVENGKALFPKNFSPGKDKLEWSWLENRPFLRCMHILALEHLANKRTEKALNVFEEMLALNPNDNQGVRELAAQCLFELKKPEEVLILCNKYKEDGMPGISYSKPLALFQLGKKEEAKEALKEAIEDLPLVANELINPSKTEPKSDMPGYITYGGKDQAWEYCKDFGRFWEQTEGAVEWLREVLEEK